MCQQLWSWCHSQAGLAEQAPPDVAFVVDLLRGRPGRLSVCTAFALWFAVRAGRFVRGRESFVQIIVAYRTSGGTAFMSLTRGFVQRSLTPITLSRAMQRAMQRSRNKLRQREARARKEKEYELRGTFGSSGRLRPSTTDWGTFT